MLRPDTAIELGLVDEPGIWKEIDLLCPSCGRRHLAGRWFEHGGFRVICRECIDSEDRLEILMDVSSSQRTRPKRRPSLARATRDVLTFWAPFHRVGIRTETHCTNCGRQVTPRLEHKSDAARSRDLAQLHLVFDCDRCRNSGSHHTVAGSGLIIAEGQSFWERHRSIHAQPSRIVTWCGIDAIESSWQSADGHRYTTWYSTVTGALLAIDEDGVETCENL